MSKCTNSKLTSCDACNEVIQDHYWFRVDNFDVHANKPCLKKVKPEIRMVLERFDIGNTSNHNPKQIGLIESQKEVDRILAKNRPQKSLQVCTDANSD